MGMVFKSGKYATLGAALGSSDTSITLTTGQGARFNTWLATQYDYTWLTVIKISDPLKPYERIKVRGPLTGDVIPVVTRGDDDTTALSFDSGERVEVRLCAPMLERFAEAEDIQTLADLRATSVGGTADAITAVHAYPLSNLVGTGNAPSDGMASVFVPGSSNTTSVPTYAPDGLTAKTIVEQGGKALAAGALRPEMRAIVVFSTALDKWILVNPAGREFEAVAGITGGTIGRTHRGRVVPISLAPTISFEAVATLGNDFWCVLQNSGTQNVTLDPASSEVMRLPDGSTYTSRTLGPGSVLVTCDGAQLHLFPFGGTTNCTIYNTAGTFTHRFNPMTKLIAAIAIGGSGAGGNNDGSISAHTGGGGGGGGYACAVTASFAASETVTVGAGGASAGAVGGASSLGAIVSAGGGGGGVAGNAGGPGTGGGGGAPGGGAGTAGTTSGGSPGVGGAGGVTPGAYWLGAVAQLGASGANGPPKAGASFGCGGGGGANGSGSAVGAAGFVGAVIIFEST
jgi:hypothetical protein